MARFNLPPRGLQTLFPSSGTAPHAPDHLLDEVALVTLWPDKAASWEKVQSEVYSATGLTPDVFVLTAGPDEWIEVMYGDISHNSATTRHLQLALKRTGRVFMIGRWTDMFAALQPGSCSGFEPLFCSGVMGTVAATPTNDRILPRTPLYLPPYTELHALGNTAAAPYSIEVGVMFVRHSIPEAPLL